MTALVKAWTTVCATFTTALEELRTAADTVLRLTVAIPWHGAAVTAVGIKAKAVHVSPGRSKPRIKAVDDDGNYSVPMASLFSLPGGATGANDYNCGCLFAASCILARIPGAVAAATAEAWQKIGARPYFRVLTAADMKAVAPALRRWYVDSDSDHTPDGMKAVVAEALEAKATAEAEAEAKAEAEVVAKAKAKADRKAETGSTRFGSLFRGMTRTKAKADLLAWIREDEDEARSFATMFVQVLPSRVPVSKADPVVSTGKAKAAKAA